MQNLPKCRAVNENRRPSLFLPEVFVFMVRYLYSVRTRSCSLIRSAHFEVAGHERKKTPPKNPLLYYLENDVTFRDN